MSKALEALKQIEVVIDMADNSCNLNTETGRELEEAILGINEEIELLRKALTKTNEQEKQKALVALEQIKNNKLFNRFENHAELYKVIKEALTKEE